MKAAAVGAAAGTVALVAYALFPGVMARLPADARYWLGGLAVFLVIYGLTHDEVLWDVFLAPREIRGTVGAKEYESRTNSLFSRLLHEPLDQFEEDVRSGVGVLEEQIHEYVKQFVRAYMILEGMVDEDE